MKILQKRFPELLQNIHYERFWQNLLSRLERIEFFALLSFGGILLLAIFITSILITSSLFFFKLI